LLDLVVPKHTQTDPDSVLHFLLWAQNVHSLSLVSEGQFLSCLLSRTLGRVNQLLGGYLAKGSNWPVDTADSVSTILPWEVGKIYEYSSFNRFHSLLDFLNTYLMSVKGAADILGYKQVKFIDRVLQNLQPEVQSHLLFLNELRAFLDWSIFLHCILGDILFPPWCES
jgi:hypothetical protein